MVDFSEKTLYTEARRRFLEDLSSKVSPEVANDIGKALEPVAERMVGLSKKLMNGMQKELQEEEHQLFDLIATFAFLSEMILERHATAEQKKQRVSPEVEAVSRLVANLTSSACGNSYTTCLLLAGLLKDAAFSIQLRAEVERQKNKDNDTRQEAESDHG